MSDTTEYHPITADFLNRLKIAYEDDAVADQYRQHDEVVASIFIDALEAGKSYLLSEFKAAGAIVSEPPVMDVKPFTVSVRQDGRGHPWASAHRFMVPSNFVMTDIDSLCIVDESGTDLVESENHLFSEYARGRAGTEFIAFFDMKSTRRAIQTDVDLRQSSIYIDLCEKVGNGQVIKPLFFFVYGNGRDEWDIEKVDPISRQRSGKPFHLDRMYPWKPIWDELGLTDLRQRAEENVRRRATM